MHGGSHSERANARVGDFVSRVNVAPGKLVKSDRPFCGVEERHLETVRAFQAEESLRGGREVVIGSTTARHDRLLKLRLSSAALYGHVGGIHERYIDFSILVPQLKKYGQFERLIGDELDLCRAEAACTGSKLDDVPRPNFTGGRMLSVEIKWVDVLSDHRILTHHFRGSDAVRLVCYFHRDRPIDRATSPQSAKPKARHVWQRCVWQRRVCASRNHNSHMLPHLAPWV